MKTKDKYRLFHLKQFSVSHMATAHKVGTDSILLGSWAALTDKRKILDVGTGCGLLSLMVAQRNHLARVVAIDIDKIAAAEATNNVKQSSWADRIDVRHISFQELLDENPKFDALISNPPYFDNSYPITDNRRKRARTTSNLTRLELFSGAGRILLPGGSLFLVLPSRTLKSALTLALDCGLQTQALLTIFPDEGKPSKITLVHLISVLSPIEPIRRGLVAGPPHERSAGFRELTQDFYFF